MTLLFSVVDVMSYSHTKMWCKSLAKFIITVFAKSIACDMWPIVKFLHFPVFTNCQCVVSSIITPTLASNYHRGQCVMLQLGPDPVSIWFSGKTKPNQKSPKNPTHLGQQFFCVCVSSLVTHFLFLEFATIVACFKFKVLDEIPVLLNLMGGEIMHSFKCEKYFIEKPGDEPSSA